MKEGTEEGMKGGRKEGHPQRKEDGRMERRAEGRKGGMTGGRRHTNEVKISESGDAHVMSMEPLISHGLGRRIFGHFSTKI
jgi:hypothetical protein